MCLFHTDMGSKPVSVLDGCVSKKKNKTINQANCQKKPRRTRAIYSTNNFGIAKRIHKNCVGYYQYRFLKGI